MLSLVDEAQGVAVDPRAHGSGVRRVRQVAGRGTYLQPSDLTPVATPFSANEIVNLASFTDDATITSAQIQSFFASTPYGYASFLDTYSSNGVRAADGIIAAAKQYTLNPLLFLVRAEMDGGIRCKHYHKKPERTIHVDRPE